MRQDLRSASATEEMSLKVIGWAIDAKSGKPLSGLTIDIWHCDHGKKYDMKSEEYRCRGRLDTDGDGNYWFITHVPPPYAGRPKHIHYLIKGSDTHQELVTQLYFKGDKNIKPNNWVKYRWDKRRILDIHTNDDGMSEVELNLVLAAK